MLAPLGSGLLMLGGLALCAFAGVAAVLLAGEPSGGSGCNRPPSPAGLIALGPAGGGRLVGATEYGGPGDPSSGVIGSSGANLLEHPDSYAELGGTTFQTATALGGLPYMTPLRITWNGRSAVAYKRDIGLGGGPIDGLPRVIDLWWELAKRLGIPYEHGLWSGPVRIERTPPAGAGNLLGETLAATSAGSAAMVLAQAAQRASAGQREAAPGEHSPECASFAPAGLPLAPGSRARLLPDGLAAAPRAAPPAVREIIAAGNQIAGKPYVYGGGHGLPLDQLAPAYDCSSSVEHLLYGARLLPVDYDAPSGALESFGLPGPGRWVTIYASAVHVFMYVAGLRWDTWNAAGPQDGSSGIGWHPLIRSAAGFVARHPAGL
jgi:hypothetical protein